MKVPDAGKPDAPVDQAVGDGGGNLAKGLVGHWKLDETTGTTAKDSSGNNNHGSLVGGPAWIPSGGQLAGALNCDGTDDHVKVAKNAALEPTTAITLSAWVYAKETEATQIANVIRKSSHLQPGYGLRWSYNNGVMYFSANAGGVGFSVSDTVPNSTYLNSWHHFAGTFDSKSGNATLYVDGKVRSTRSGLSGSMLHTGDLHFMGDKVAASSRYIGGHIDDVRIYDRALSPQEVQALRKLAKPLPANPVAWWKFDEATGLVAKDSAGGNHGSLQNGALWTTGKVGWAVKLDGVNDYVNIPDSAAFDFGTGGFSISAWFKTSIINDHHIVNFRQNDNSPHIELYAESLTHGYLGTHILPNGARIKYYASKVNDGKWHHAAVTMANGKADGYRLYLDGTMVGKATYSGSLKDWDTIKVGDRGNGDRAFNGSIDEVMVYSRELSDKEIKQIYQYGSTP